MLLNELSLQPPQPGTRYIGLAELQVTVAGRLVASGEAALWTLRDAVAAQLLQPPAPGTLIDLHGRTWADMSLVEFRTERTVDRGRVWSIAYRAEFLRFRAYPQ